MTPFGALKNVEKQACLVSAPQRIRNPAARTPRRTPAGRVGPAVNGIPGNVRRLEPGRPRPGQGPRDVPTRVRAVRRNRWLPRRLVPFVLDGLARWEPVTALEAAMSGAPHRATPIYSGSSSGSNVSGSLRAPMPTPVSGFGISSRGADRSLSWSGRSPVAVMGFPSVPWRSVDTLPAYHDAGAGGHRQMIGVDGPRLF